MKDNSIMVIQPYRWNGLWVFDDVVTGLVREALIGGADVLCNEMSLGADRFVLMFSATPFPKYHIHLQLLSFDEFGHNYTTQDGREAWLCPALLLYFNEPPSNIYARALPMTPPKYEQHFSRVQNGPGTCK